MRKLDDYVTAAVSRNGLRGEKHLASELGLDKSMMSQYLRGRAWPSEKVMLRLAEKAGLDPDVALLELAIWRAKEPEVRRRFQRMRAAFVKASAAVLLLGLLWPAAAVARTERAQASTDPLASVYYGKSRRLWRRLHARQMRGFPGLASAPA